MSIFCPFDCTSAAEIPSCTYVMIPYDFLVDVGVCSSVVRYCVLQKSLRSFKETLEQVGQRASIWQDLLTGVAFLPKPPALFSVTCSWRRCRYVDYLGS